MLRLLCPKNDGTGVAPPGQHLQSCACTKKPLLSCFLIKNLAQGLAPKLAYSWTSFYQIVVLNVD